MKTNLKNIPLRINYGVEEGKWARDMHAWVYKFRDELMELAKFDGPHKAIIKEILGE